MPEKPKRNRDYVVLAAAVLGMGVAGCDRDEPVSHTPPSTSGAKGPAKPPAATRPPSGSRMGK